MVLFCQLISCLFLCNKLYITTFTVTDKMLTGRIAFVTGAGSGIGRATCQLFAEEGASVVAVDINEKNVLETLQNLKGEDHMCLKVDIRNKDEINDGIDKVKAKYKSPPTVAVNCAGIFWIGSLFDITDESFSNLMDVNVKGAVSVTQFICKELIDCGKSGSIVNIASVAAHTCGSDMSLYAMTKAALEAFSKSVAKEMSEHNIRVNSVMPSFTNTPFIENAPKQFLEHVPVKFLEHSADPKEVAQVILFLASDRSSYVSGSSYSVTAAMV